LTNKELLKETIKTKGYRVDFIAKTLGISSVAMSHKMQGRAGFSQEQIKTMQELLCLTTDEVLAIFLN